MSEAAVSVDQLINRLAQRDQTLAVAESLTGGELCAQLTSPPGASRVVRGALVVYSTDTKADIAGVDPALLATVGPVDPVVAEQLATGARNVFGSSYGVGITGVAGPSEQAGHPVGEVHIAVATPDHVVARTYDLGGAGDRQAIRASACGAALSLLEDLTREG